MTTDVIDLEMKSILAKPIPDDARNARRAAMCLAMVTDMTVDTDADCEQATDELRGIKEAWDTMEADRTSFTGPLNAVLDKLNARFQPHLKTLKSAEAIIKGKIAAFLLGKTQRITAARDLAEREADAERLRLAAQAEALRTQAEAQKSPAVRARLESEAAALEQTAAVVIAQPAPQASGRPTGITPTKAVDFELTDMLALIKHIVTERPDLVVLLKLDEVKTRAMVKMLGLHTHVPGLRVFPKNSVSVR